MPAASHPIYFIRHGQVSNPAGVRYRRRPGFHLSLRGWQQAQQLRRALASMPLQAIVHSPLERAQETASVINQSHGLPLAVDERIHEWDQDESFASVLARMAAFYGDALGQLHEGPIAVVGHSDPTRALLLALSGQLHGEHEQDMGDAMPLPAGGVYRVTPGGQRAGAGDARATVELIFAPT